jgi:RND family efflux transporter MFP subunit
MKKKFLIITASLLLGGAGMFFWKIKPSISKNDYQTAVVEEKNIKQTLSVSGEIEAEEQANLRFQTSGRLAWVGVEEGDQVDKWQALASLDKRQLEKQLKQELLDYMNTRWDVEQNRDDYDVDSNDFSQYLLSDAAKRILEQDQFSLDRTVLDVEIKDIALEYSTLVSPINGIVTRIEAPHPGMNITPANSEIIVANPEKLRIAAEVDEIDIGKVHEGQQATIFFDAYPDQEIKSQVEEIKFTPISTRGGGTAYIVILKLPNKNPDQKYKLGMNADIDLLINQKKNALVVPFEALSQKDEKTVVEVLENGRPQTKTVETGIETDFEVEINKGLEKGQQVIIQQGN